MTIFVNDNYLILNAIALQYTYKYKCPHYLLHRNDYVIGQRHIKSFNVNQMYNNQTTMSVATNRSIEEFQSLLSITTTAASTGNVKIKVRSIGCAQKCFEDPQCESWSYHLATKKCHFYVDLEEKIQDILQPGSRLQENNRTIGWASGRKACSVPGVYYVYNYIT